MDNPKLPESTLRDYVRVLFRQKAVLIVSFLTVMITVYVGLQLKTPEYEAGVKMLISGEQQAGSLYYRDLSGYRNTEIGLTRSEIVKSIPVIELVVNALQLYHKPLDYEKSYASPLKGKLIDWQVEQLKEKIRSLPETSQKGFLYRQAVEDLRNKIEVEPIRDTNLFTIRVRDQDPVAAAILANVTSRAYIIFDLQQQLAESQLKYGEKHPLIEQLQDHVDMMSQELNGEMLEGTDVMGPATVKIIEQAIPAIEPIGPPKILILALAFFMSIFLGVMLAFIFEYMDQRIKGVTDLEEFMGVPLVGAIPKMGFGRKVLLKDDPKLYKTAKYIGAYSSLSDQIRLLSQKQGAKVILLTEPEMHEGVTSIISNIAFYLSHHGGVDVLVIDANFREPEMYKIFKVDQVPGFADVITEKAPFDDGVRKVAPHLYIMPSGLTHVDAIKLLSSAKVKQVVETARRKFDVVLVDCPDLKRYKDALVMASHVDGVVLLVSEGKTRRHVIESVISPLREKRYNLLGAILNNRRFVIPKWVYDRI